MTVLLLSTVYSIKIKNKKIMKIDSDLVMNLMNTSMKWFILNYSKFIIIFQYFQGGQITPQLALKVLLQFDKAINTALANRVKNRIQLKVRKD